MKIDLMRPKSIKNFNSKDFQIKIYKLYMNNLKT